MQLNGSQIFVEVLCEQGVDTIFGYPGGAVLNLYDELYKNADRITHVLTAHEQGAAHAADGYARATGRTGEQLEEELIRSHKVWVNCGEMYGTEGYVRLNIACPRSVLAEGLRRFTEGIKSILSSTGLA